MTRSIWFWRLGVIAASKGAPKPGASLCTPAPGVLGPDIRYWINFTIGQFYR